MDYKKISFVIIGILTFMQFYAQNLVPNPSFENYTSCPSGLSQFNLANPWTTPTLGTSDLMNTCSPNTVMSVSIPSNYRGYQYARTGDGYAHIFCYPNIATTNYREYLQVQLTTPLVAGQVYEVSFYTSLSDKSRYAINNLGAYLSVTPPSASNNTNLNFTPQINETSVISDTTNWVLVTGTFTATGGEQYLTIGNFYDDASTTTIISNPSSPNLFSDIGYYIDDVSVIPASTSATCGSNCGVNIIQNPGFETYTSCPTNFGQGSLATPWNMYAGTPDYYNCTSYNYLGQISGTPASGQGVMGIAGNVDFTNVEYISQSLTTPLMQDSSYCISFDALFDSLYTQYSNGGVPNSCMDFGVYVYNSSSAPTILPNGFLNVTPTYAVSVSSILTGTYQNFSFNYVASGGEDEIIIGYFQNANTASCISAPNSPTHRSYINIDNVSLKKCSASILPPPVATCDTSCAPNLAPNPTFEGTTVNCSDTISEMFTNYSQVQGWFGIACDTCPSNGTTPDYYNSGCGGPSNTNTCDGSNGSVGFFTYLIAGANAREYVQAQLLSPLVAGQEYCVSVQVRTDNSSSIYKPSDGFGIWFTNQKVDIDVQNGGQYYLGPGSMVNATPQIENPSGNYIDYNCQIVSGTFIATGTEQWVVIGNFKDDANTNFSTPCGFFTPCAGYMIIDNLSIREACTTTPLPPTISLNLTNDTICNGSCTDITASVSGGTPPFVISWDNGLPNGLGPHNVCPNNTTTYTAIVTDSAGLSDTASITLYVNNPSMDSSLVSICSGDSVFAGGNWQFASGNYYDTLVNSVGCDSIFKTILTVLPNSNSTINASICTGDSLYAGGGWQTTSGTYFDTLSNYLGCDSIITTNLLVSNAVLFNTSTSICQGDSILLGGSYQTTAGTYNDTIFGGSASGCDSVIVTALTVIPPVISNQSATICQGDSILLGGSYQTTAGTYNDTIFGGSTSGCDSIVSTVLTVNTCAPPTASFTVSDTSICEGACITFTDNSSGATSWNWSFTGGTPSNSTAQNPGTVCYSSPGTYPVVLIVSNANGSDTAAATIDVFVNPTVFAGNDTTIDAGNPVPLNATGAAGTFVWNPSDWLSCNPCQSPVSNPLNTITYTVSVTDSNGCSAADEVTIFVEFNNVVYIPNIFSPNGDGNNDFVFVRGYGIQSLYFVIYDRWGEKVFETTDQNEGWDGTFRGKPMNKAVFVYYAKVTFYDGSEQTLKGDITLIR